jgi:uncharacterized protein (TIGR03437 family)
MKCISVLLACAAALSAQTPDFITGQAARLVIGQQNFTAQDPNSSDIVIGGASGLAFAGDTLFVADSNRVGATPNNHRVLLYKGASSMFPSPTATLPLSSKCPACVGQATLVLGQPNFTTNTESLAANASSLRLPTAVASDGVRLVVADTNHNRLLIWLRIPTINNQPADVVVGQPDFNTLNLPPATPTDKTLRGPQGVWIQDGRLFVADTQNNRVVIYNRIPTTNGAAADLVLGAPNFTTFVEPDLTQQKTTASATTMLNPVSVTSDGTRLFVTDLGFNRVLVWNTIPTANTAPADFALGQPDLAGAIANNAFTVDADGVQTAVLCTESNGTDDNDKPTYPGSCNATLNFPRFALSDGQRLFIADGGNDRVLVYKTIPTASGASADSVIGQIGGAVNQSSDAADSLRGPLSLAWDGVNLYVSDAFNRRITVYSMGQTTIPYQGVRNAASFAIYSTGSVSLGGTIQANDVVTVTINEVEYAYTVTSSNTLEEVTQALADAINNSNDGAGNPYLFATADTVNFAVRLKAREPGPDGNNIYYSVAVTPTSTATVLAVASGANLTGGADAAKVAAGTIVSLIGTNLSAGTVSADLNQRELPRELGGTRVYFNGVESPLLFVSPTQINAQVPWEALDSTSINAFVRSEIGGRVIVTTPVAVSIVPANPGIFTSGGDEERAVMYHGSSQATAIVSVDGSVIAGDIATITIETRTYTYTIVEGDTLDTVRDALVLLINQDPKVSAEASGIFDRILLRARIDGPEGNGIAISGSTNSSGSIIVTAFSPTLCCANVEGSVVTDENPAIPGEVLVIYATGLGLQKVTDANKDLVRTGVQFPKNGPVTEPASFVSSLAGGKTADVFTATFLPGTVGTYKVILHLNSDLPTDSRTGLTISQDAFTSNVARFPVVRAQ